MPESRPPLDPRKYPWHRGDLVTRGFDKSGFVASVAPQFLEVLWMPEHVVEQIDMAEADNLLRLSHADSVFGESPRTNLESLEAIEALTNVEVAIRERVATLKTDAERESVNKLIARAFASDGCAWDQAHQAQLMTLAIKPSQVGLLFRFQEWMHRRSCKQHSNPEKQF